MKILRNLIALLKVFLESTTNNIRLKSIKVLGVNVNDYGGNGAPVVFVHSFPLTSKMWDEQVVYFSDKYRVITYDTRGLGNSFTDDNVYSMEKMVNDFFHIINNLKLPKVHAVGLSMGGYMLLRAVIKDSERFNSMTLINTKADKDEDEEILKRSSQVIKIKSGGRDAYLKKLLPNLIPESKKVIFDKVKEIISSNTDEGICGNLLALSTRINTLNLVSEINVPVLLISGTEDTINPSDKMELLFSKFRENRNKSTFTSLLKMANCGHLCNMENPGEFNKFLEWFLKGIEINS